VGGSASGVAPLVVGQEEEDALASSGFIEKTLLTSAAALLPPPCCWPPRSDSGLTPLGPTLPCILLCGRALVDLCCPRPSCC